MNYKTIDFKKSIFRIPKWLFDFLFETVRVQVALPEDEIDAWKDSGVSMFEWCGKTFIEIGSLKQFAKFVIWRATGYYKGEE